MLGELTGSRTALSTGQGPRRGQARPAATQLDVPVRKHATQTHQAVLMGPACKPPSPPPSASAGLAESSAWAVLFSLPQGWWQCYCVCFHIPEQAGATLTSTLPPPRPETGGWLAGLLRRSPVTGPRVGLPCCPPCWDSGAYGALGVPHQHPRALPRFTSGILQEGRGPGSLAGRGQAPVPPPSRGPGPSVTTVLSGQRLPVLN